MKFVLYILLYFVSSKYSTAVYYDISDDYLEKNAGKPLFLTEYIEKGLIAEAQEKARVRHPALEGMESYSGYITINKTYNTNSFFWFFPSQTNPKEDPVFIWFIGGPGVSVMLAIFIQNGPLMFTTDTLLQSKNYTLTMNHSVIYIDNPVGTGYSFTDNNQMRARNLPDTARDVTAFLVQFFQLFPEYRKNDFYVAGDSFGGKFVISVGNHIRNLINQNKSNINLKGIVLGNGLIDLEHQGIHSDFLYNVGLIDKKGRDKLKSYEISGGIRRKDEMVELLPNLTGFDDYSNFVKPESDYDPSFQSWVMSNGFRKALHTGDRDIIIKSNTIKSEFEPGTVNPVTSLIEEILQHNYRVLIYNGQLDMMFPYTSSQNLYEKFKWPYAKEYVAAERKQWFVDGELAGYVKVAGNFCEVLVRDAGHITFKSQPKWSTELVTRFTHHQPIAQRNVNAFSVEFNLPFLS